MAVREKIHQLSVITLQCNVYFIFEIIAAFII